MNPVILIFRPPIIGLVLLIISILSHIYFPIRTIIPFPFNFLGISGIVIGLWLMVWGKNSFAQSNTPLVPGSKPTTVVTTGPFSFTRNPMYLGMLIILTGASILMGSITTFFAPLAFFIIFNFFFIPFEERLMHKTLSKKYGQYKNKVRRWI